MRVVPAGHTLVAVADRMLAVVDRMQVVVGHTLVVVLDPNEDLSVVVGMLDRRHLIW